MAIVIDIDSYPGIVGNGIADDSTAIQAASTAAGVNGVLNFGPKTYFVGSTIVFLSGQRVIGRGANSTWITRTGDFGDTFRFGTTTPGQHAGACKVSGFYFSHGPDYAAGNTTLTNKATSGAHINFVTAQGAIIEDCWMSRLPYGIHIDGGANIFINTCNISGVWDPLNVGCQEGIANIYLNAHNTNPTLITINDTDLGGPHSASRNYTYSCTNGNSTKTGAQGVGSKWGIFNTGCEGLLVKGGCIGANSQQGIFNYTLSTANSLEHRYEGVFFDSAGGPYCADLYYDSAAAGKYADGVVVNGCTFNGELYGQYAIFENNSADATKPAINNFSFTGNTFGYYTGTPIFIGAAQRGVISGNTFNEHNYHGIGTTDSAYVDAIYLGSHTADILCIGNMVKGAHAIRGTEIIAGSTGVSNHCMTLNGTYTA